MAAGESRIVRSGFLSKKGEVNTAWQKRWFILRETPTQISYHKDAKAKASGVIRLDDYCLGVDGTKENGLMLIPRPPATRTYFLDAPTKDAQHQWIEAFGQVGVPFRGASKDTSAFAIKQGTLKKMGGKTKNWKVRFFVVRRGVLFYFENKEAVGPWKPIGSIPLFMTSVSECPESAHGKANMFQIFHPQRRTYYFQAERDMERKLWTHAIEMARAEPPNLGDFGKMSGWLEEPVAKDKWRRLWFVLEQNVIWNANSPTEFRINSAFDLDGYTMNFIREPTMGKLPITFRHPFQGSYVVYAATVEEQQAWLTQINKSIRAAEAIRSLSSKEAEFVGDVRAEWEITRQDDRHDLAQADINPLPDLLQTAGSVPVHLESPRAPPASAAPAFTPARPPTSTFTPPSTSTSTPAPAPVVPDPAPAPSTVEAPVQSSEPAFAHQEQHERQEQDAAVLASIGSDDDPAAVTPTTTSSSNNNGQEEDDDDDGDSDFDFDSDDFDLADDFDESSDDEYHPPASEPSSSSQSVPEVRAPVPTPKLPPPMLLPRPPAAARALPSSLRAELTEAIQQAPAPPVPAEEVAQETTSSQNTTITNNSNKAAEEGEGESPERSASTSAMKVPPPLPDRDLLPSSSSSSSAPRASVDDSLVQEIARSSSSSFVPSASSIASSEKVSGFPGVRMHTHTSARTTTGRSTKRRTNREEKQEAISKMYEEATIKTGVLQKLGGDSNSWQRRVFVLKPSYLAYFKTPDDMQPTGVINLKKATVGSSSRKDHCFCINKADRTYFLTARDAAEKQDWMAAVQHCVEMCMQLDAQQDAQNRAALQGFTTTEGGSPIIRQGFMAKKGGNRKNWTIRFFTLKRGFLSYARSEAHVDKPLGVIPLTNSIIQESDRKPYSLTVSTPTRTYYIDAKSYTDKEEWIAALKAASV